MSLVPELPGLQQFRIQSLPPEFYYIPNFLTAEEETSMLQKVVSILRPYLSDRVSLTQRVDSSSTVGVPVPPPSPSAPIDAHQKQHSAGSPPTIIPRHSRHRQIRRTADFQPYTP